METEKTTINNRCDWHYHCNRRGRCNRCCYGRCDGCPTEFCVLCSLYAVGARAFNDALPLPKTRLIRERKRFCASQSWESAGDYDCRIHYHALPVVDDHCILPLPCSGRSHWRRNTWNLGWVYHQRFGGVLCCAGLSHEQGRDRHQLDLPVCAANLNRLTNRIACFILSVVR